jgi:hypothetical protein
MRSCEECQGQLNYCPTNAQCCYSYLNDSGSAGLITGYKCDGTWLLNYSMAPNESLCMSYVYSNDPWVSNQGCCSFNVYNPSSTLTLTFNGTICNGGEQQFEIDPLSSLQAEYETCITCISQISGPWEYLPCTL